MSRRILTILLIIAIAFCLMAPSCDPDPEGSDDWNTTQKYPGWEAEETAQHAAEEFHTQLTQISRDEAAMGTPEP
jgi:hypothetical protein